MFQNTPREQQILRYALVLTALIKKCKGLFKIQRVANQQAVQSTSGRRFRNGFH
jgi:hypothetical protein